MTLEEGCKDMLRHVPPACTLLIHNLHIVDDIFELNNMLYFIYFLQKMELHKTCQLFIRWTCDAPTCWSCRTSNISRDFVRY
jgi:hypothetical protein